MLDQLPPKTRKVILMDCPKISSYHAACKDFLKWLKTNAPSKVRTAKRAEALAKLTYLKKLAVEIKLPSVFEWVDNFLETTDRKILLFIIHHDIANKIIERYKGKSILINGKVNPKKRQHLVDIFQHDPNIRVMVGNIKAAGVGLNMTKANAVAMVELAWTPDLHIQAEDRAWRLGQEKEVDVFYPIAAGTIEEKLCQLLQDKQEILEGILDNSLSATDLNIFDCLVSTLEPK